MMHLWYEIESANPCPRRVSETLFYSLDQPQERSVQKIIVGLMKHHRIHYVSCSSHGYYLAYQVVKVDFKFQVRMIETAQDGFRVIAEFWQNPFNSIGRLIRRV